MAAPAYETHADAQDPAVQIRLTGLQELGDAMPTLKSLMKAAKVDADNGRNPFDMGTVEVGLLLSETSYEALCEYASGLRIVKSYGKRRRRA
jgi:hypothetical protein